jgi:hypothetical protein
MGMDITLVSGSVFGHGFLTPAAAFLVLSKAYSAVPMHIHRLQAV